MNFADRLNDAIRRVGNPIVAGLDPSPELLPPGFLEKFPDSWQGRAAALGVFGLGVVDALAGLVPAIKIQAAYYESQGPPGLSALQETARHARSKALIVVIDGKRNDIGSTAAAYAAGFLGREPGGDEPWDCDALTVNPYLGTDGIAPFADAAKASGKGLFVLVRTSNPSAGDFQDLIADGRPIYRHVAERLKDWAEPLRGASGYSSLGAVVGATYPAQLDELRAELPGVLFLVPGYGTQGGTAKDVAGAFDERGLGAIVNNSRGLIYAHRRADLRDRFRADWQGAIAEAARLMADDLAAHTSAGRLRTGL